jgi:hypothetical protein
MATTALDRADCGCGFADHATGEAMLPVNPYTALQYHFGMLLGVDDLETAQGYPRGKIRLHNAWLHREGVVWGFDVGFNARRELAVKPGLALDAAGRELHLDVTACVDLGKWYDKHKEDKDFNFADDRTGGKIFDAHVVARFRACLGRPVPAIADPCAGSEVDTAFSRISETVELLLRPGKAWAKEPAGASPEPDPKDLGYHRLRILFSLEDDAPEYDEVKTRREAILALPLEQQPRAYLDAFREFAALDEIDLGPQDASGAFSSLFPEDPTDVVLADVLGIHIRPAAGVGATGFAIADPLPVPNVRVRRSHVATATIQELLCGPLFTGTASDTNPESPEGPGENADSGPRVDDQSVKVATRRRITMNLTAPVDAASVGVAQFSVTTYTSEDGWNRIDLADVKVDAGGTTIVLNLKDPIDADRLVRLIARGTGPHPILGIDQVPLAGGIGGPPGSANDGHDFVIMLRRN